MKRRDEVLVGITATLAIVAGIIGSLWLARGALQPGYPLFAKFTWGAGLRQGQSVLLAGVNIGYVEGVEIRQDGLLIVKLRVRKTYRVPLGTTATIEPNGFFGDQLVALHPSGPNPRAFTERDTIPSGRPTPQIGDVLARIDTISGHLSALTASVRKEFVEGGALTELRVAVRHGDALLADMRKILAIQSDELTRSQLALRKATNAIDSVRIDSTLRALSGAAKSITEFTADLHETSTKLNAFIDKADHGPGSFAKLMNDSTLHANVRNLVARMDSLTADFQKNPRKYIKLSIF